jgi:hypothetical protein
MNQNNPVNPVNPAVPRRSLWRRRVKKSFANMIGFKKRGTNAELIEINAAISGTGSDFGACRLADDILSKKPDLVFMETAANVYGIPSIDLGVEIARQEKKGKLFLISHCNYRHHMSII